MKTVSNLRGFAIVFLLVSLNSGCDKGAENTLGIGGATKDLSIGRMKVSIMPEYDDPSVLAIYDGRFEEVSSYPIKTSFLIPKGSVISDACSLSHEGQHFCQLYKTVNKGNYDEVSLILPYPNFYLSFHTPQLDVKTEKKAIDYQIKANHPIRAMEIDIQQPLRSTAFNILPPETAAVSQKEGSISVIKGFNHFIYRLESIAINHENTFKINYIKSDPNPSVDIKYTSMKESQAKETPYETQRNIKTMIYVLFGTGTFGIVVLVAWYFRSWKKRRGKQP
ncbi:MAG: hypothetical protein A2W28_08855 [Gammaproteobacteria bacterium RBG_16_51_14]|nr:MAG: hypothetical protein A2W28_08855 [Gammaproteobacteria bacterium RBG_16_51_14]